jgi:hypothetical protein
MKLFHAKYCANLNLISCNEREKKLKIILKLIREGNIFMPRRRRRAEFRRLLFNQELFIST